MRFVQLQNLMLVFHDRISSLERAGGLVDGGSGMGKKAKEVVEPSTTTATGPDSKRRRNS